MAARLRLARVACLLAVSGCIAPSVLDAEARRPVDAAVDVATLAFVPVTAEALAGLWRSIEIDGAAAGALLELHWLFERDGRCTGAALVAGETGPVFQTLDGRFTLAADGTLDLGDGQPIVARIAGEYLRLAGAEGGVLLKRAAFR